MFIVARKEIKERVEEKGRRGGRWKVPPSLEEKTRADEGREDSLITDPAGANDLVRPIERILQTARGPKSLHAHVPWKHQEKLWIEAMCQGKTALDFSIFVKYVSSLPSLLRELSLSRDRRTRGP